MNSNALLMADKHFYILCAMLVLAVGYILYTFNAYLQLRGRSELSRGNAELQAEIIERQRAQKQLTESEHRQRLILESQPECVKQVAVDGSLLYMNRAGLNMIEADHLDQVVGHSV